MFKTTKQVPNLELCKKLKELGFPQDGGGWYWDLNNTPPSLVLYRDTKFERIALLDYESRLIKAPTVQELEEWLPYSIVFEKDGSTFWLSCHRYNPVRWNCGYVGYSEVLAVKSGATIVETMAKLLIRLIEDRHIKFPKISENQKV